MSFLFYTKSSPSISAKSVCGANSGSVFVSKFDSGSSVSLGLSNGGLNPVEPVGAFPPLNCISEFSSVVLFKVSSSDSSCSSSFI